MTDYEVLHLAAHLEAVGMGSKLHDLLQYEHPVATDGQPSGTILGQLKGFLRWLFGCSRSDHQLPTRPSLLWYDVHQRFPNLLGFWDDVERAWRLATEDAGRRVRDGQLPHTLGLQVRYAAMLSSASEVANRTPPEFLRALIERDVMSASQALLVTAQVPEVQDRASVLTTLAPYLAFEPALLARSVEVAGTLPPIYQCRTLAALAARLPPGDPSRGKLCQVALAVRDSIECPTNRSEATLPLIGLLDEPERQLSLAEVEATVSTIEDPWVRLDLLLSLASLYDPAGRARLAQSVRSQLDSAAPKVQNALLANRARKLAEVNSVGYVLEMTQKIGPEYLVMMVLPTIADLIDPQDLPNVLAFATTLCNPYVRAQALVVLAPMLSVSLVRKALVGLPGTFADNTNALQKAVRLEGLAGRVLYALLRRLGELGHFGEGQTMVRAIAIHKVRALAHAGLAPFFPFNCRPTALQQAFETVMDLPDPFWQAKALADLAPHLPAQLQKRAWEFALKHTEGHERSTILQAFTPLLPTPLIRQALGPIAVHDEVARANMVGAFAKHMPGAAVDALYEESAATDSPYQRALLVANLLPHLPPDRRLEAVRRAEKDAAACPEPRQRAQAFAVLYPRIAEAGYWRTALAHCIRFMVKVEHTTCHNLGTDAVTRVIPWLPNFERTEMAVGLLKASLISGDVSSILRSIEMFAEYFRAADHGILLAIVQHGGAAIDQARTLKALIPHLLWPQLDEAVRIAGMIDVSFQGPGLWAVLAGRFAHFGEMEKAICLADTKSAIVPDGYTQGSLAEILVEVASRASPAIKDEAARLAANAVAALTDVTWRVGLIARLAPYLEPKEGKEWLLRAWEEASSIPDLPQRAKLFAALVTHAGSTCPIRAYECWSSLLRTWSVDPRPTFLARLVDLLPVVRLLEPGAIPDILKAVLAVGRLWP